MDTNAIGASAGGFEIVRMIISLVIVLGMMWAASYWLKRRGGSLGLSNRRMRIIERLPIDSRRSILLVHLDGEELVIGVGSESITPIRVTKKGGGDAL